MLRLLAAAAVAAMVAAGCGGARSDEDTIRDTVSDYFRAMGEGDGDRVCSLITPASRAELGGRACPDVIAASAKKLGTDDLKALRDVDVDFTSVRVTAGRASVGEGPDDEDPIELQKVGGKWLVDQRSQ